MKHHEFASLFPMLSDAELQSLADDIKANGLQNPIVTLDDEILDGRNRYRACEIAGVLPNFTRFVGTDPLAFVLSHNLHRRHLNESQLGIIGSRVATMRSGERTDLPPAGGRLDSKSINQAAAEVGVSPRTIERARRVERECAPEVVAAVEAGDLKITTAETLRELPKDEQSEIAARGREALQQAAKELRDMEAKAAVTPPPPATTKRIIVPKIGIGMDRAERAIVWLEEISPDDPQRAEALTHVIGWCNEQLTKLP